jgi:hypothetical protein
MMHPFNTLSGNKTRSATRAVPDSGELAIGLVDFSSVVGDIL